MNGRTLDRKGGDLFGVNPIARSAFRKILLSKASIHLSIGRLFSLSRNFDLGNQFGLAVGGLLIGFDGEVSGGTRVGASVSNFETDAGIEQAQNVAGSCSALG